MRIKSIPSTTLGVVGCKNVMFLWMIRCILARGEVLLWTMWRILARGEVFLWMIWRIFKLFRHFYGRHDAFLSVQYISMDGTVHFGYKRLHGSHAEGISLRFILLSHIYVARCSTGKGLKKRIKG